MLVVHACDVPQQHHTQNSSPALQSFLKLHTHPPKMAPWLETPHSCPSPTLTPRNGSSTLQRDLSPQKWARRLRTSPVASQTDLSPQKRTRRVGDRPTASKSDPSPQIGTTASKINPSP
ncbi:hypothetical protein PAXRUDRAFT_20149 [Paxillus rubicundulus Ve08.2h10]|uniref:Uncharacterized protein n=1 Tax=Paxillus rubicundulus Ve08.2h10 TaxID=930991 RepID=A0A0D0CT29_9AGAM|nr:hypothetical protein PAXRUDRAFT_20149 [Paxillus rubicundulus Ve08.2h10]